MKHLFSNRSFVLLMLSDLLQNVGIWIRNMALLFFIMEKSGGDPVAVSLITVIEYAPIFLFSIVGGVLADRWRPKRTMLWGDILSFLSVLLIFFVVAAGYWQAVFVVTLVSAIVSQFSQPSSMKIIKRCLPDEHVPAATALSQTMMSLFVIAGPIAGTAIFQSFGLEASLLSLLAVFGGSALLVACIPSSIDSSVDGSAEEKSSFVKELREGMSYVGASRMLKFMLIIYVILALGSGLIQPLDIFVVTNRLHLDMTGVQWFTALEGFGMLVGGVTAAVIAGRLKGSVLLFSGLAFLGVSTFVEVLSVWPLLTGTLRFLTGFLLALAQTALTAVMIRQVDEKFVGRLNGLMTPAFTAMLLIGSGSTGVFMASTSIFAVYFTAGILFLMASLISLRLPFSAEPASTASPAVREI
ncbi:MFS transporter [Paenibacillus sp. DMB20]|uniref:MFS transporter n=1 Tax=Paenibacillus sp. DMB20 TaxID=1642570 RepID=UPI000627F2A2|nr:MFS transporter [Paenibacillus sp. DMB20]KKO52913.1 MFS transporter [Paenibacillus sp. DMB20]KKO54715.1 MFS transporter [Paenibacillus sp. DMB20]